MSRPSAHPGHPAPAGVQHAHIPGARFVPLESRNHLLLETEPAWARLLHEARAFS